MTGQVVAAALIALLILVALPPALIRDVRRSVSRRHRWVHNWNRPIGQVLSTEVWESNLRAFMVEERVAMSIRRPTDFVKIDLT